MYDINILKYCAKIIKKYNIYIKYGTRLPLNFPLPVLKEYTNALFLPNKLYVVYEKNKRIEDFINSIKFDEEIEKHWLGNSSKCDRRYNIPKFEYGDVKVINKNIIYEDFNKYNLYKSNMEKIKSIKINYNYINFLLNENNHIINKFELTRSSLFTRESNKSILCTNDRYYNNYEFFEKLLKNPNYIFEFKIYDNMYDKDRKIMLLYYLVSLLHNKVYPNFVIEFLLSTVFNYDICLSDNKFILSCFFDYYNDIYILIYKIPHKEFRQYFKYFYEVDDEDEDKNDF